MHGALHEKLHVDFTPRNREEPAYLLASDL